MAKQALSRQAIVTQLVSDPEMVNMLRQALGVPQAAPTKTQAATSIPEFRYELTEAKGGAALKMSFNGGLSRFMYVSEMKLLAKHFAEVQAAIAKIK